MFYSAINKGFYSREIHGENIPSDAVEITHSVYVRLLQEQVNGRPILSDVDGYPYSASVHVPTEEEVRTDKITALQVQIDTIEAGQRTAIREAVLNKPGAVAKLVAIDNQVAALRAQKTAL